MSHHATFTILLAKQDFKFSCAHFIVFSAEHAELLHGHNYQVSVELSGRTLDDEGLLIDLARFKKRIRDACARLDTHTLIPSRSRHLEIARGDGSVEFTFRDRRYRFPEDDVLVLSEVNTSIEVLAKMLWGELATALEEPSVDELGVSVSQTSGQSCWYRAPIRPPAS